MGCILPFNLNARSGPLQILCLGAHSDDLEIGCGGTVLRFLAERIAVVHWVVLGCSGERSIEAQRSAESLLAGAKQKQVEIHRFRDGFFPYVGLEIKEAFEKLKDQVSPDLIFTHTRADLHQDHRLVNELTWNTFREHLILEYEIPKYDGDLGLPNLFVALDVGLVEKKIRHLLDFFATQRDKRWFDEETFRGLLRLRGVEAGVHYAEAFYARKVVF
jgi:LmbE family N-acetylglucosaminyl deacetylase